MISVILPIYKVEEYLPKCIDSLLAQTYPELEIILVDDGSPDGSPAICDSYAKKDSRIIVIHQKNSGVSAARNAGLRAARGAYIGFVDPDDWVAPEMYEGLLAAMQESNAALAICGYEYYDETGNVDENRRYPVKANEVISQKEVMRRFSDMPPSIRHGVWNKLFLKSLLQGQEFKEGLHSSEDVLFLTDYVNKIQNAVVVHRPYYNNLVRRGSATHGGLSIRSLAESFPVHEKMYVDAVSRYPDLKDHSMAFLMDVLVLKYNEAKRKAKSLPEEAQREAAEYLRQMRRRIRYYAPKALTDREIFWKTRISYLIVA